ncbi:response regulator [Yoonia litorea]|uniref:Two-component system, chemotaxis family, response regulator CheY n=1 Tax=Yoonia litorea TaxID=1123755 RepID=A0A1I6MIG2_9RHOB|nr:response regulator [Yoonia litorea]SFS15397.1 two-component system, chemotaxis family, response regulator CheY [Yoonia litorea]
MTTHVLAIDDSRTIRTLLTMALEEAGFKVTTAVDGVEGVEKFGQVDPDLVITDVNMPKKDGFGVIEDIRKGDRNRTVPVLVLTTESGAALKERARAAGATGWIVKPFEDASLISVIRRLTGG